MEIAENAGGFLQKCCLAGREGARGGRSSRVCAGACGRGLGAEVAADGVPVQGEQDPQCLVARGGGDERREAENRGGAGAWGRRHRHRFRRWRGGTGSSRGARAARDGGESGGEFVEARGWPVWAVHSAVELKLSGNGGRAWRGPGRQ